MSLIRGKQCAKPVPSFQPQQRCRPAGAAQFVTLLAFACISLHSIRCIYSAPSVQSNADCRYALQTRRTRGKYII